VTAEILPEAVLAFADAIEARRGPPASDPSLAMRPQNADPLVHQLVYSMLLWESSHRAAGEGLGRLLEGVVDYNELRVCSLLELRDMLPRDFPRREERADRLLCTLNAIFLEENGLSLMTLQTLPKREARQYLDAIDALPAFGAARVMLIGLGGHAFPADDRLAAILRDAGALAPDFPTDLPAADLVARLERAVRAADAPRVYALLESEADHRPSHSPSSERPARSRSGAKRTAVAEAQPSDPAPTGDHAGTE
jgi:hypothetical protein